MSLGAVVRRRSAFVGLVSGAVLALSACSTPVAPVTESLAPSQSNPASLAGVTWLDPIGTGVAKPDAPFDPYLDLSVAVFRLHGDRPVGPPLAVFATADGGIDVKHDRYQLLLLHTRHLGQVDGALLRVEVRAWNAIPTGPSCGRHVDLEAGCLAYLDLRLVANRGRLRGGDDGAFPVVNGQALPIKLHAARGTVNLLDPAGGLITGPEGMLLGLMPQPATAPVAVEVQLLHEPLPSAPSHPVGSEVVSPHFLLRPVAGLELAFDASTPLVVAIPASRQAAAEPLRLAVLSSSRRASDGADGPPHWTYVERNVERDLFVAPLLGFEAHGTLVTVVDVGAGAAAAGQVRDPGWLAPTAQVRRFEVTCSFVPAAERAECERDAAVVASTLEGALAELGRLGFRDPRLSQVLVCSVDPVRCESQNAYRVTMQGNLAPGCSAAGYYDSLHQTAWICWRAPASSGGPDLDAHRETAVHELFHAVQAAYDPPWSEYGFIEGSATLAERSILDGFVTRSPALVARDVGTSLLTPCPDAVSACADDHRAQDFFAYAIRASLGPTVDAFAYLHALMEEIERQPGPERTLAALDATLPFPFASAADAYWGWVKNQVCERTVSLGYDDGLGPCTDESGSFSDFPIRVDLVEEVTRSVFLPPLTARWFDVEFTAEGEAEIALSSLSDAVVSKIYLKGEGCLTEAAEGPSRTVEVGPGGLAYVLIANAGSEEGASVDLTITPSVQDEELGVSVRIGRRPISPRALTLGLRSFEGDEWREVALRDEAPAFVCEQCEVADGFEFDGGAFTQRLGEALGLVSAAGGVTVTLGRDAVEITVDHDALAAPDERLVTPGASSRSVLLFVLEIDSPQERRVTVGASWDISGFASDSQPHSSGWNWHHCWVNCPTAGAFASLRVTTPRSPNLFHVYPETLRAPCNAPLGRDEYGEPPTIDFRRTSPFWPRFTRTNDRILGSSISLPTQRYEFLLDTMAGASANTRQLGDDRHDSGPMRAELRLVLRIRITSEPRP